MTLPLKSLNPRLSALSIAGVYILVASAYIIISTLAFGSSEVSETDLVQIELTKGLAFVFTTGLALLICIFYLLIKIDKQHAEILRNRVSISELDQRATAGLLASAIGHDANNLLTSVKLSIDRLRFETSEEKKANILDTVSKLVDELSSLNYRLIKGGLAEQKGEFKECCLRSETERVLRFIDENHPLKKLRIEFTGDNLAKSKINRHLFFQVILNLLSNVSRHAGESAKVEIHVKNMEGEVLLEIHDDGPGVKEEHQQLIFEPFYSQHAEGSGLGLASVKGIMTMHNGDIQYKPSKLGGACFAIKFPKDLSSEFTAA